MHNMHSELFPDKEYIICIFIDLWTGAMDDSQLLERWRSLIPSTVPLFELITHSLPYAPSSHPDGQLEDGEHHGDEDVELEEEIETFPCECRYDPGTINSFISVALPREDCACGPSSKCVNRELFIECSSSDCPVGAYCQNQRFQRLQYANVEVIPCEEKGHGLKTLVDLKPY